MYRKFVATDFFSFSFVLFRSAVECNKLFGNTHRTEIHRKNLNSQYWCLATSGHKDTSAILMKRFFFSFLVYWFDKQITTLKKIGSKRNVPVYFSTKHIFIKLNYHLFWLLYRSARDARWLDFLVNISMKHLYI